MQLDFDKRLASLIASAFAASKFKDFVVEIPDESASCQSCTGLWDERNHLARHCSKCKRRKDCTSTATMFIELQDRLLTIAQEHAPVVQCVVKFAAVHPYNDKLCDAAIEPDAECFFEVRRILIGNVKDFRLWECLFWIRQSLEGIQITDDEVRHNPALKKLPRRAVGRNDSVVAELKEFCRRRQGSTQTEQCTHGIW